MALILVLKIPFMLLGIVLDCLYAAVCGTVSRPRGWGYSRNLRYALLRSLVQHDATSLTRILPFVNVRKACIAYLKKRGLIPEIVELENGTWGGWIGRSPRGRRTENVLMYFHGGGYVTPPHPKHIAVLGAVVDAAHAQGKDFSVFVLEYGLSPAIKYPTQKIQAATALKYLLEDVGYEPENIYVAGDSAGGHLAISLLSHLSHPHPAAPRIDLGARKLAGMYLFSPWVTFDLTSRSMRSNADKDYVSPKPIRKFTTAFMGDTLANVYNVPLSAEPEWWRGMRVEDLCVVAGEYEVLRDDIEAWVKKVRAFNPTIECYAAPAEVHVQCVVDRALHIGIARSEEHFKDWIVRRL